ncbi:hypothetical protein TorRG33x02_326720 [Trema orientale]|uniref:Uncharacterized protein n=1 Tax=Trema orientale TaxID=63057 RepID=A0A2P5BBT6_TREOI|nr:hypothetical protein TorRG33x02_326720 [Trema orientale]
MLGDFNISSPLYSSLSCLFWPISLSLSLFSYRRACFSFGFGALQLYFYVTLHSSQEPDKAILVVANETNSLEPMIPDSDRENGDFPVKKITMKLPCNQIN